MGQGNLYSKVGTVALVVGSLIANSPMPTAKLWQKGGVGPRTQPPTPVTKHGPNPTTELALVSPISNSNPVLNLPGT